MNSLDDVVSLLQYGFVQRAFIIGAAMALLSSLLSVFIVLKNASLVGDSLAHTAFGGLAAGYYFGLQPWWTAGALVVVGSMGITKITRSTRIPGDAAVAVMFTLGLSSGILFLGLGRGFGINLESLLFGSILLVSSGQIMLSLGILATAIAAVLASFPRLLYTVFNERQAQASGVRTWVFDYMLSGLTGVAVIVSIPISGVLLIAALLVLPGLSAVQVARSFRQTMVLAPIFGLTSVVVGLVLSLFLDVAPGATIVLTGLAILFSLVTAKSVGSRLASRRVPPAPAAP
jgi:zinc transport system permease protein